ncbi:MAG: IgGFc-binding protein [Myxococcota bacterium]|nr:IgGFc-binding protein [Myxococcota bacterium]
MQRFLMIGFALALGCSPPVPGGEGQGGGSGSCSDGALRCLGGELVQVCIAGSWQQETLCGDSESCVDGICVEGACAPGSQRCELGRRQRCADDETSWEPDPCPEGTVCQTGGTCGRADCDPGTYRCATIEGERWPQRERCADDGSAWENAACRRGQVCVDDGACQAMECVPNSTGCVDDRTIGRCNDDGTALEPTETCPDGTACSGGSCTDLCSQARSRQSYDGCVFFAVDLPNSKEAEIYTDPYAVSLANPHEFEVTVRVTASGGRVVPAASNVQVPGATGIIGGQRRGYTTVNSYVADAQGSRDVVSGPIDGIAIPAGGVGVFILPNNTAGLNVQAGTVTYQSELMDRAYKVEASAPVTAYQFSPLCCSHSYSNDASILFPAGSQGRSYVGVSLPHMTRMQGRPTDVPSFLAIVGSDQAAEVEVNLGNRQIQPVAGVRIDQGVLRTELEPYEVLTLLSANSSPARSDLTGVSVRASAEVAMFGGHVCTEMPHGSPACDHVESSLMPTETWRNEYIGTHTHYRSSSRSEVNYYRVTAAEQGARLRFDPPIGQLASHGAVANGLPDCRSMIQGDNVELRANGWCEFGTRQNFVVRSDSPMQMVQFITSQDTTGLRGEGRHAGDPAMSAVPPSEQYRNQYTFLTPDTYHANYLSVIHPVGALLELDGVSMTPGAMGTRGRTPYIEVDSEPVGRENRWALTIIKVGEGAHSIQSLTGDRFGIMAYAYDDYVSYAFPGGLDLAKR